MKLGDFNTYKSVPTDCHEAGVRVCPFIDSCVEILAPELSLLEGLGTFSL